jgi:hypothetical protein
MFDPETTPDDARAYAREIVDVYGAHVNPGAGVWVVDSAHSADVYYAFVDELHEYSLEQYKNIV